MNHEPIECLRSDDRMNVVWKLFQKIDSSQKREGLKGAFMTVVQIAYEEALEMKSLNELKLRRDKIRGLAIKAGKALGDLSKEADALDGLCSVKRPYLGEELRHMAIRISEIVVPRDTELLQRDYTRLSIFIGSENVPRIGKRGQENYPEMYVRAVVAAWFKLQLGEHHYTEASIVAAVVFGANNRVDSPATSTRKHLADRARAASRKRRPAN